jgi:hypothetical protein
MMTERKQCARPNSKAGIGLVFLLLFSTLGTLAVTPSASANSNQSLGIVSASEPDQTKWYSSFESIDFTIEIYNYAGAAAGLNRGMSWYVCEGDVSSSVCKSGYEEKGIINIGNVNPSSSVNFTSLQKWTPGQNSEGLFTVLFAFDISDSNPSDDELRYVINVTIHYADIIVNEGHNPLENLNGLAVYQGLEVINTDTDYVLNARGQATVCDTCNLDASFGWQLWSADETILLKEAYRNVTDLFAWGGFSPFNLNLPAMSYSQEGEFVLKWGAFESVGTPYADMNTQDNIAQITLIVDDSIDLQVSDLYPSHDNQGTSFYYGIDRVHSVITNQGNMTVSNVFAEFEVYSPQFELEVELDCLIDELLPGESTTCMFNMTTTGNNRLLRVRLPNIFQNGEDVRTSDNVLTVTTNVEAGKINPTVQQNIQNGIYRTSDTIELVARFSEIASQPLNFTWRQGFYVWGQGQVLNKTGADFGLGHHNISLEARDPFGTEEYTYVEFDVLNAISIEAEPYFTGEAVTELAAYANHEIALPYIGTNYAIGGGKSPLMLIGVEILAEEEENDPGLRGIEISMNLSELLPDSVELSTVDLRILPTMESSQWNYIEAPDLYVIDDDYNVNIELTSGGTIMLIGTLPPTNATVKDLNWTPLEAGQIQLDWTPVGDIANPYVGGWNIYKFQGVQGSVYFPDPDNGVDDGLWEELTLNSLAVGLTLEATQWTDPEPLETGTCASYAVIPVDREGNPNYQMVNVTRVDGVAGLLCGDAIPPTTDIIQFDHSWAFTNDTDCFDRKSDWSICYVVNLTWTWPDHEAQGELMWNLYRVESKPTNVNLKYIDPIAADLKGIPGEQGTYNQSGIEIDGIRSYRTYYYILAPVDYVGNEQQIASYPSPSIERVNIEDDWWTYNDHLIPEPEPEPEPPLGVPWLKTFNEYMLEEEFQYAGGALLATLLLNFILLPVIIKKRKRLKRVVSARKRNSSSKRYEDEFDEFFE